MLGEPQGNKKWLGLLVEISILLFPFVKQPYHLPVYSGVSSGTAALGPSAVILSASVSAELVHIFVPELEWFSSYT